MDFNDEREDLTDDGRARPTANVPQLMLPEIAQQAKEALDRAGIDTSLFFHRAELSGMPSSPSDFCRRSRATTNGVEWPMSSPRSCGNWSGWLGRDAEKWCARPPTQLLITPALRKSVH